MSHSDDVSYEEYQERCRKIDQEQAERTRQLEEIAQRYEEQRQRGEKLRVEVVCKPQTSDIPLELQRRFREEENALIAQHRGQERFDAIASGNRKLMREMRKAEEDALAKLHEQQRKELEEILGKKNLEK